jgi:hypothetical protein
MTAWRHFIEKMPGVIGLKDGHAWALGTSATLPTCEARREGEERLVRGTAGVATRRVICAKSAADAYGWTTTTGTTMTLGPWVQNDIPGTATTEMKLPYMDTTTSWSQASGFNGRVRAPAPGRVVGAFLNADAACLTGSAVLQVGIGGSGTAFKSGTVDLDPTSNPNIMSGYDPVGVAFVENDNLSVVIVTSSFTPTTANLWATLVVRLDQ